MTRSIARTRWDKERRRNAGVAPEGGGGGKGGL